MRKEDAAMIDERYIGIGNEIWCYVCMRAFLRMISMKRFRECRLSTFVERGVLESRVKFTGGGILNFY